MSQPNNTPTINSTTQTQSKPLYARPQYGCTLCPTFQTDRRRITPASQKLKRMSLQMHVNTVHPEMAARWGELERKLPMKEYFGSRRLGVSRTGQQSDSTLRTGSGNEKEKEEEDGKVEEEEDRKVEEEEKEKEEEAANVKDVGREEEPANVENTTIEHSFTINPYQEGGGQDKEDSVYPPLCEW